jgi:hypothetical protein
MMLTWSDQKKAPGFGRAVFDLLQGGKKIQV